MRHIATVAAPARRASSSTSGKTSPAVVDRSASARASDTIVTDGLEDEPGGGAVVGDALAEVVGDWTGGTAVSPGFGDVELVLPDVGVGLVDEVAVGEVEGFPTGFVPVTEGTAPVWAATAAAAVLV